MVKVYDVITMGSGLVDAYVYPEFVEKGNMLRFKAGTKILLDRINFTIGGGGSNSATCFSKFGLKTGFLGKIGSGYNAQIILRELKKSDIDFLGLRGNDHTGYSIILSTDKGNRTILSFKGASDNLKFREIKLRNLKTKWFYLTSMGRESFLSQKKVALYAKKKGIKLAYNPGSHVMQGVSRLIRILRNTYFLILNLEEAMMLASGNNLFKELRKFGPKIVCITNGSKEGGIYDGDHLYRYWPNKVKVVDVTGAGDVFGSSFITGLVKLENIEDAIKIALLNSESLIQVKGAHNGLLGWRSVLNDLKMKKFKIKKEIL